MAEEMKQRKGYRFRPSDVELIIFLTRKMRGLHSEVDESIAEVDLLKHEPWDLPAFSKIKSSDPYWYLIYQLNLNKYKSSKRADRKTQSGCWKVTGKERQIWINFNGKKAKIGTKKTLVFKPRHSDESQSKWVIHEYHVNPEFSKSCNPNNYVICRLKKKLDGRARTSSAVEGLSSPQSLSNLGNDVVDNTPKQGVKSSDFGNHVAGNAISEEYQVAITGCDVPDNILSEWQSLLCTEEELSSHNILLSNISYSNGFQTQIGAIESQVGTTESQCFNSFSSTSNGSQIDSIEFPLSNSFCGNSNGVQNHVLDNAVLDVRSSMPKEGVYNYQSPPDFGNCVTENTIFEVNPMSPSDPGAISGCDENSDLLSEWESELYIEKDLSFYGIRLSNGDYNGLHTQFDSIEPLSNSSNSINNVGQTQFESPLPNSFNGGQSEFGSIDSPLSYSLGSNYNGVQNQFVTTTSLSFNNFGSDYNGVQTQFGITNPEDDFAPSDSHLINRCEGYIKESFPYNFESGGLNFNCSFSGTPFAYPSAECDGEISSYNHEEAVEKLLDMLLLMICLQQGLLRQEEYEVDKELASWQQLPSFFYSWNGTIIVFY
ncbi:NAM domain-containing protein [Cephalotus follicularis]|uniref:NAM domain-containing protein n=1 Tax=Cephalotus follicularis TaxID=3775 RepID=A0A1Q3B343_CEPFO|nr:NAM domain-containing protein [Cephalotus follicularis]